MGAVPSSRDFASGRLFSKAPNQPPSAQFSVPVLLDAAVGDGRRQSYGWRTPTISHDTMPTLTRGRMRVANTCADATRPILIITLAHRLPNGRFDGNGAPDPGPRYTWPASRMLAYRDVS